jgi:universal stress protein A
MTAYKHILVAIDMTDNYGPVIDKAVMLQDENCRLSLLHCIEPVPYPENYAGGLETSLFQKTYEYAERELAEIVSSKGLKVSSDDVCVETGRPGAKIHGYSVENGVDLVVVGSHGKQGLQLLLGSVSSNVLHQAEYDVLAVSLKKTDN